MHGVIRDVSRHYAVGADDGSRTYPHAAKDYRACAHPGLITNLYRSIVELECGRIA